MVNRTELEVAVRQMVAYDVLSKPLSSLGQKAGRKRDRTAKEISSLLTEGEEFERVIAYTEERKEEKARTLREGIDAFKELHPNYGKILEGLIEEKRHESNTHLVYAVREGYRLGQQEYRTVMRDLGMTIKEADAMYPHLIDIAERLGKAGETTYRSILL